MALSRHQALWRDVSPRGMATLEYRGVFVTEYRRPTERVLFCPVRDANPFFHFFEALWIMDGRDDVAFLNQFNSNIGTYSDDGVTFNAPYGYRLRRHFRDFANRHDTYSDADAVDQLEEVITLLQRDPSTRRAVLCLWDPAKDLNKESKDIPCNDLVMFKLREGVLDMTVTNRSNDAMWGAYGANAVQFSMLMEFVALAVGAKVGTYRQVSDSFHMYTSQNTWLKCKHAYETGALDFEDPYVSGFSNGDDVQRFKTVPLMPPDTKWNGQQTWREWLFQNNSFLKHGPFCNQDFNALPFFVTVAFPLWQAWKIYKGLDDYSTSPDKNKRILAAQEHLFKNCKAEDWMVACCEWLQRRSTP
jgi:hypothetical protein